MAKIELRLSKKVQPETGMQEIMIRLFGGIVNKERKTLDAFARSGVYVNANYFEYYINRKATINPKVAIPDNKITCTERTAIKNGWSIRNSGEIVTDNRRTRTEELTYHIKQAKEVKELCAHIIEECNATDKELVTSKWLAEIVDKYRYPEKYTEVASTLKPKTIYELIDEFASEKTKAGEMGASTIRHYKVVSRMIARYEHFVRATQEDKKDFTFDVCTLTREDIEDFTDYARNEKSLYEEYTSVFDEIMGNYPLESLNCRVMDIYERGGNSIIKVHKKLKALLHWYENKTIPNQQEPNTQYPKMLYTTSQLFSSAPKSNEKYGNPYYITVAERDKIASIDLRTAWETIDWNMYPYIKKRLSHITLETLLAQRDIFTFQCMVGCRVGDLQKFSYANIQYTQAGLFIVYVPHKTKDEGETQKEARVPLLPQALALIEKYRGIDKKGRLFPHISSQKYNDAIKIIFTLAGITRNVNVRNSLTGETEARPINELASSHLARRTFIGNAYLRVQDPNLIGAMSGHVENSKAFKQYRNIEDSTLAEIVKLMG